MTAPDTLIHDPLPLPAELWERIAASPRRLLMLDYDGTLAPFHIDRMAARPDGATIARVSEIATGTGTHVAIVSGRPLPELETLVGALPVDLIGEHGWEERISGQAPRRHELPESVARRLDLAARASSARTWADRIERKRASIVLHTRGLERRLATTIEEEARALWQAFFDRDGLQLDRVDGGLELRAIARHKGEAVGDMVAREPEGTLPVYLGDDCTDEAAFERLRSIGITVCVVRRRRASRAQYRLPASEVPAFLKQWLDVLDPRRQAPGGSKPSS